MKVSRDGYNHLGNNNHLRISPMKSRSVSSSSSILLQQGHIVHAVNIPLAMPLWKESNAA